ncbi:MAG: thiamine biosynthesis protein ThiS [Bacteroidetes bacterium 43-16]|nr:MAG: thiamine biosynthesis protein ThiS [Bacteroidetes bacterium 43-16]
MELIINHQTRFFDKIPGSLAELMHSEAPEKEKGIAVALNHQVIPRQQWPKTPLQDQDTILIITATQGG